mgnify:CR=1 FL=1
METVWQSTGTIRYGEVEGCLELTYPANDDCFRLQVGEVVIGEFHAHIMGDVGRLKNMLESMATNGADVRTASSVIDRISKASH